MMLHRMAVKLSEALARRGIFSSEDAEVYAYGLELMLSTAVSILLVIIISFLFSRPLSWLFFLVAFIPLRLTAGGYHANTHLKCIIVFSVGYAALLALSVLAAGLLSSAVLAGISAGCFILVLAASPVPSPNKPLTEPEKRRNRRRSLILSAACLLLTMAGFLVGAGWVRLMSFFVMGQLGAAVLLIVALVTRKHTGPQEIPGERQ